ncbi:hypothetical protein DFH06DRAFT_151250 [Mycena polygramma]|nr:hypothetical protein DFH06DRAFT_151250 [Mycena polygramma]
MPPRRLSSARACATTRGSSPRSSATPTSTTCRTSTDKRPVMNGSLLHNPATSLVHIPSASHSAPRYPRSEKALALRKLGPIPRHVDPRVSIAGSPFALIPCPSAPVVAPPPSSIDASPSTCRIVGFSRATRRLYPRRVFCYPYFPDPCFPQMSKRPAPYACREKCDKPPWVPNDVHHPSPRSSTTRLPRRRQPLSARRRAEAIRGTEPCTLHAASWSIGRRLQRRGSRCKARRVPSLAIPPAKL